MAELGRDKYGIELVKEVGDLTSISFYYLLRVAEYIIKGSRSNTKQKVEFKWEDAMFFRKEKEGRLRKFPINATGNDIITAYGATLKIENKKKFGKEYYYVRGIIEMKNLS